MGMGLVCVCVRGRGGRGGGGRGRWGFSWYIRNSFYEQKRRKCKKTKIPKKIFWLGASGAVTTNFKWASKND